MNAGGQVGGTTTPGLTPFVAKHFGWNMLFWVTAGLCFPGALLACDRSRTTEANAKARMVDSRDFQGREING
jgi:predicted MFS family arabinose efflux permease